MSRACKWVGLGQQGVWVGKTMSGEGVVLFRLEVSMLQILYYYSSAH